MAEEFKVGDVVTLKSGGPPMTIQSKTGDKWFCTWTEEDGTTVYALARPVGEAPMTGSAFVQSSLIKKAGA